VHPCYFDLTDSLIREEVQSRRHNLYLKKLSKLTKLCQDKVRTSTAPKSSDPLTQFHPRVLNLSNVTFQPEELNLLNQGLSYAPSVSQNKSDLTNLVADTELALFDSPMEVKLEASVKMRRILSAKKPANCVHSSSEKKTLTAIKKKLHSNNLILSKADKGNTITILEKGDYIHKVEDFISTCGAHKVKRDPTASFQKNIISNLKMAKGSIISNTQFYSLRNMNPNAPILYGLPKIHKDGIPIRPVVSYVNAPAYKLCKFLNSYLRDVLEFDPKYSIKNSICLVDRLKAIKIDSSCKLISLDVKNLFPSVPLLDLKQILDLSLKKHKQVSNEKANIIMDLVNTCLRQNYFIFNNDYFIQDDGLPMGSPLSPLLAEIFMDNFECNIFSSINLSSCIRFYSRYVDDVLMIWTGSERQLNSFFNAVNSLNKNIQFTMEIGGNCINFLDLSISILNNQLHFDIFRKPTFTDTVIPSNSNHPAHIKSSAFYSLTNRLLHLPLNKEAYDKELSTIYNIALGNGYDTLMVDKIIKKVKLKIAMDKLYPSDSTKEPKVFRKLPYLNSSVSYKLSNLLKRQGITSAFYNNNTIKSTLVNNKLDKTNIQDRCGVYEIQCNSCPAIYIGQSGRSFKKRFSEHLAGLKSLNNSKISDLDLQCASSLANHCFKNNHLLSIDLLRPVHIINKGFKLDLLEALEIKKAVHQGKTVLNDMTDLRKSPMMDNIIALL
jgi:hypothetical protein